MRNFNPIHTVQQYNPFLKTAEGFLDELSNLFHDESIRSLFSIPDLFGINQENSLLFFVTVGEKKVSQQDYAAMEKVLSQIGYHLCPIQYDRKGNFSREMNDNKFRY